MLKFGNFICDKPGKILIEREKFNDMRNRKQTLKVSKPDVQQGASNLGVFVKRYFISKYFISNSFGQLALSRAGGVPSGSGSPTSRLTSFN